MPNLPSSRQAVPSPSAQKRAADRRSLTHAFRTFTEVAGALEKSYTQLQAEVGRLRGDLECANADLSRSLEETSRVRTFLGRVLEGLPCGVLVLDSEARPRLLNPAALRLLDMDADWSPAKPLAPNSPLQTLLAEIAVTRADGEGEWQPRGSERIFGLAVTQGEKDAEGKPETICILRDISDEKRLAAERENSRRAHALAEISAVLAHELRNPLGSMELFTGLLADATGDRPEEHEWVEHLQVGLRSLGATVNNVLQFHGQPAGNFSAVRLDVLLRETAAFLGPLARQRGLRVEVENSLGKVNIQGDRQRLQQVFLNLALNAFQAMTPGGTLRVSLHLSENSDNALQIAFQDEGSGISVAQRAQIFEPGFSTKAGSPGLGLAVCRQVVEQHDGRIAVEERIPHGTTFAITLPHQAAHSFRKQVKGSA
jgi:signal transduction histidine kinase